MKRKKFYRLVEELFGEVLRPHGFCSEGSKLSVFYRRVSEDFYHIVSPDIGTRGAWYDIKVFCTSPLIEPMFEARFPDELGIPTDRFSYLNPRTGVGPDQECFGCSTEMELRETFYSTVKPSLLDKALSYLDKIKTLHELEPLIRSDLYLGYTLYEIGKSSEAIPLLKKEKERLSRVANSNVEYTSNEQNLISSHIEHIGGLLTD
jgi:hypothetical protein